MRYNSILGLAVGGFQTIDEEVFIPLRRLTLLFGPNSAGKSAIEDALGITLELFGLSRDNPWDREAWTRWPRLSRHWRRNGEAQDTYAPRLTLGVRFGLDLALSVSLAHEIGRPEDEDYLNRSADWDSPDLQTSQDHEFVLTVELLVTYVHVGESIFEYPSVRKNFSILLNGRLLAESNELESYFLLDFSHPVLAGHKPAVDFELLAKNYPKVLSFHDGVLRIFRGSVGADHHFSLKTHNIPHSLLDDWENARLYGPDSEELGSFEIRAALGEIALYYDHLYELVTGNLNFSMSLVAASRTIPTNKDLQFLCWDYVTDGFSLDANGDPQYRRLADSLAERVVQLGSASHAVRRDPGKKFAEMVDRMLTEHLFIERGYRLDFEYLLILSSEEHEYLISGSATENFGILLKVWLADSEGRRFSFEEVGSGLGYVLPILCSACDQSVELSVLQQPELHLHPALQSALGDVMIECARGKKLIVETHSEHMLLRILKRIRQTHSKQPIAADLQLHHHDVSVLYFDPTPEGRTRIRQLRISEDGEFLDRWPRGFFSERDQELFDE